MKINYIYIINIFIGFFIICYTLYIRLLVIRLPKDLFFISGCNIKYSVLFFVFFSFTLSFIQLFSNISILLNHVQVTRITKILHTISKQITNGLTEVYYIITNQIPDAYNKISLFCSQFYYHFGARSEAFLLFLLFGIRLCILVVFLFDVFIYFQLYFFYKALSLMCFYILIKVLLFILKDFSDNLDDARSMLIIEDLGIDPVSHLPLTTYCLKEDYQKLNLEYYVAQYVLCSKLSGYLYLYDKYDSFFTPRINVIIYLFYFLGWSYIIYFNSLNIFLNF